MTFVMHAIGTLTAQDAEVIDEAEVSARGRGRIKAGAVLTPALVEPNNSNHQIINQCPPRTGPDDRSLVALNAVADGATEVIAHA